MPKITSDFPKNETVLLMHPKGVDGIANSVDPKGVDGIANSVDPDQTAPLGAVEQSDEGLHGLLRSVFPELILKRSYNI